MAGRLPPRSGAGCPVRACAPAANRSPIAPRAAQCGGRRQVEPRASARGTMQLVGEIEHGR